MELIESIKPIIKYWWLVALTLLIVLTGVYLSNRYRPESFDGFTTVFVRQTAVATPGDATNGYDGFYAVQAGQGFADTVETWLKSPEIVSEIYQNAELIAPSSQGELEDLFTVDKVVSQSIAVRMNALEQDQVFKLMEAMGRVTKVKAEKMLVSKEGQPLFTIDTSPVLVLRHEVDIRIEYGVAALGGLGLGLFLAYLTYAWANQKKIKVKK